MQLLLPLLVMPVEGEAEGEAEGEGEQEVGADPMDMPRPLFLQHLYLWCCCPQLVEGCLWKLIYVSAQWPRDSRVKIGW
jgi:hypothetical protein